MNRTAVILFAGNARREEAQKGLPARFLAKLHARLERTIRTFAVDLIIADDFVDAPTLNEKIERVFEKAFARGYSRVIALAGDILLPSAILRRAIEADETLIGGTCDGGFYLLATDGIPRIDWTSLTFEHVAGQLECETLSELRDVDSIDDARRVAPSLIPIRHERRSNLASQQLSNPIARLRAPPSFA